MSEETHAFPVAPFPPVVDVLVVGDDAAALLLAWQLAKSGAGSVGLLCSEGAGGPRRGEWIGPVGRALLSDLLADDVPRTDLTRSCLVWNPLEPVWASLDPPLVSVDVETLDRAIARRAAEAGVTIAVDAVESATFEEGRHRVTCASGAHVEARLLVDAAGLSVRGVAGDKAKLAAYRNMTIWIHLADAVPVESLAGASGSGRAGSGWGCEDGWYWYVPVDRADGASASLGMVVDPATVKRTKNRYLDERYFLSLAKQIPLLGGLVSGARCDGTTHWVVDQPYVAQRFAEFELGRLRVGAGARFVDPYLWSDASQSLHMALEAARLAIDFVEGNADAAAWEGYEARWRQATFGAALLADQVTHRVASVEKRSVFWKRRGRARFVDLRAQGEALPEPLEFDESVIAALSAAGDDAISDGPYAELRP